MRRAIALITLALAACGQSRDVVTRAPAHDQGPPLQFVQPVGSTDPSCGPQVVPPAPPGRFPGACNTFSDLVGHQYPVRYGYDDGGALSSWWTIDGSESWSHDDQGRLTSHVWCGEDPSCCQGRSWAYDEAGRLAVESEDHCGHPSWTRYHYDGGRLAWAELGTTALRWTATFRLDDAGSPLHEDELDLDGGLYATTDWTYDGAGRMTSVSTSLVADPQPWFETWAYDDAGHLLTHTSSEGDWQDNRYVDGQLVESSSCTPGSETCETTTYCGNGLPHADTRWTGPAGGPHTVLSVHQYWYDDQGIWTRLTNLDGGTVATRKLDDAGNVLELDGMPPPHGPDDTTRTIYDYSCFSQP